MVYPSVIMILIWLTLGLFVYLFIGIQIVRFVEHNLPDKSNGDDDVVAAVIMWPLVVIIGGFILASNYITYLVKKNQ